MRKDVGSLRVASRGVEHEAGLVTRGAGNLPPGRYVVAGTGGRRLANPATVKEKLDAIFASDLCSSRPNILVLSGMAEGYDEVLARSALEHRIPFWAAVPNRGYGPHYWGNNSVSGYDRMGEFNELLAQAEGVTYVCRGIYEGGVHANFVRNQWMVDHADILLVGPGDGGTRDCIRRARQAGVMVVEVLTSLEGGAQLQLGV